MEKPFEVRIEAAIRVQIDKVITALEAHGVDYAITLLDNSNAALQKPLMDLYKLFASYEVIRTERQINRSETKAGFGINQILLDAIIAYFRARLLERVIKSISETTKAIILKALIEGRQAGLGVREIVARINAEDISKARARLIVRTEAVIAMNYGRELAKKKSRYQTESVWIAAHDDRTRHSHRYIDGTRVDEGKKFMVPIYKKDAIIGFDLMAGPGDPTASAGNVCNCRCTMATVAKRDHNGRLMLKRNISVILPGERNTFRQVITV